MQNEKHTLTHIKWDLKAEVQIKGPQGLSPNFEHFLPSQGLALARQCIILNSEVESPKGSL